MEISATVPLFYVNHPSPTPPNRDKFPEELRGDHMSGPLWFGAECLAAGSSVLNHESESDELRPLGEFSNARKSFVWTTIPTRLQWRCTAVFSKIYLHLYPMCHDYHNLPILLN